MQGVIITVAPCYRIRVITLFYATLSDRHRLCPLFFRPLESEEKTKKRKERATTTTTTTTTTISTCMCVRVSEWVCVCVCVCVIISLYGWGYFCVRWYGISLYGFYGYSFLCLVGCFSMIIWTPTVLSVLYARVVYFCICTCSAQLSMFHVERRSRNTLSIIIIITNIIIFIVLA